MSRRTTKQRRAATARRLRCAAIKRRMDPAYRLAAARFAILVAVRSAEMRVFGRSAP